MTQQLLEDTETRLERSEEELSWVGLALAETLRVIEVAVIGFGLLLVSPPLLILAVVVIVPTVALAAVVGAVVAVVALPVYVVRHLHGHHRERAHGRIHRLAQLGRRDSRAAASGVRRLLSRAQAKLYVKHDRTLAPPR